MVRVKLELEGTKMKPARIDQQFLKSRRILEEMLQQRRGQFLKRSADVKKTFEENFQQLTDAILMEHFPKLRRYDLGFQLVDKSDDNSRGLGIRAFRVRTLAFIPFFYDNGMVGGYEIIFLPKENLCIPSSEAWLTYLTSKTGDLGKATDRVKEIAVIGMPNLLPLRRPMIFKAGSEKKLLPQAVRSHKKIACSLIAVCDKYPFLVDKLVKFYGTDLLKTALHVARQPDPVYYDRPVVHREMDENLIVYTEFDPLSETLGPRERHELEKKGYYVIDKRAQTQISRAIPESKLMRLVPIDSPGLYRVLDKDGKTREILVLYDMLASKLVGLDTEKNTIYAIASSNNLAPRTPPQDFARRPMAISKGTDTEFRAAVDALNKRFKNNPPYRGASDDNVILLVDKDGRAASVGQNVNVVSGGSRLEYLPRYRELVVPVDIVVIRRPAWKDKEFSDFVSEFTADPFTALIRDVENKSLSKLNIKFAAPYYVCNGVSMEKGQTLIHLMRDWGFRESDALNMLKHAARLKRVTYFVKRGEDWLGNMAGALNITDHPSPIFPPAPRVEFAPGYGGESRLEVDVWVPGLKRPLPIRSYLDPPEVKHIQIIKQLADANNGEAFDVGMLASLLNVSDSKELIDEYIPALVRGLDSLGRILLILYRHKDDLKERYGKEDYVVIMDKVKTNFKNVGELIIHLMQDNIDALFQGLETLETEEER